MDKRQSTIVNRQPYYTISLSCSQESVDKEWTEFKQRYAGWQNKFSNQSIPFELDEEKKCVNVFCTMTTLERKWLGPWMEFGETIAPDLGSRYFKSNFDLKKTEEKIKLDEEKNQMIWNQKYH